MKITIKKDDLGDVIIIITNIFVFSYIMLTILIYYVTLIDNVGQLEESTTDSIDMHHVFSMCFLDAIHVR